MMKTTSLLLATPLVALALTPFARAERCCPAACVPTQTYRISYDTVYEDRQMTAYRLEYETVYEDRQVTTYRPVWETATHERRYKVARQVAETAEHEERYKVLKPVWETHVEDRSYDQVRAVCETAEREERYQVAKPVYETSEREEHYTVRREVLETAERDEVSTVMEPVTTYTTNYVDQGHMEENQVCHPGPIRNRLRWDWGRCVVDPATGCSHYERAGFYWTPVQGPATVEVQRVWRPNVVAQQVPQTTLVARQITRKVPIQTVRYVDEPMVRKVPVQTCRIVYEEQVRKVPITVQKQVVERIENKVPVQVCRMVEEEVVRKVPVTTYRTVEEERVEQVPVQTCRYEAVQETVRTPRVVCKQVPVNYTYRVPHVVQNRVLIDPCTGVPVTPAVPMAPMTVVPGASAPAPAGSAPSTYYNQGTPTPATPPGKENGDASKQPEIDPNQQVPESNRSNRPGPVSEDTSA